MTQALSRLKVVGRHRHRARAVGQSKRPAATQADAHVFAEEVGKGLAFDVGQPLLQPKLGVTREAE